MQSQPAYSITVCPVTACLVNDCEIHEEVIVTVFGVLLAANADGIAMFDNTREVAYSHDDARRRANELGVSSLAGAV